ncbi:hypothetical protein SAMN04489712_11123 [Thermomonospora echinospora]|uniref:Uncharacterized protein n=1 Tax=Thermomonospora echinospora TaxID=1992 RepID=A0A1H6CQU8_9ACTN|nr:hypothetical protein [Thermomonospora echinospora]SEG75351.1 hypothetical protein SAMN04489712_11123 [Thermomonospora echinospora]
MPRSGGVPAARAAGVLVGFLGAAALLPGCGGAGGGDPQGGITTPGVFSPAVTQAPTTAPNPPVAPDTSKTGRDDGDDARYTYFGLRLRLRPEWRVAGADRRGRGYSVEVRTGDCVRTTKGDEKCPGFLLVGPEGVQRAYDDDDVTRNPYTPARPYHPRTDVQVCLDRNAAPALEAGPARLTRASMAKVAGREATYRQWRVPCRDESTGRVGERFYVQREWYLAAERILIVDRWQTPGLDEALAGADWG